MAASSRTPKLTRAELELMELLWSRQSASVRDIHQALPARRRPAYTTVQTMLYRLEAKGAVRRAESPTRTNVFEPAISRLATHRRLIDDFMALFGGRVELMARLVETGKLTLADIDEVRRSLRNVQKRET
jgi:BlaI family penicillinase repressor